jgi:hypothetical protein
LVRRKCRPTTTVDNSASGSTKGRFVNERFATMATPPLANTARYDSLRSDALGVTTEGADYED